MASSQLEGLEDDSLGPRPSVSFVYNEGQRQAVEALLAGGTAAYIRCLQSEGLRPFLSTAEARLLQARCEAYHPGEGWGPTEAWNPIIAYPIKNYHPGEARGPSELGSSSEAWVPGEAYGSNEAWSSPDAWDPSEAWDPGATYCPGEACGPRKAWNSDQAWDPVVAYQTHEVCGPGVAHHPSEAYSSQKACGPGKDWGPGAAYHRGEPCGPSEACRLSKTWGLNVAYCSGEVWGHVDARGPRKAWGPGEAYCPGNGYCPAEQAKATGSWTPPSSTYWPVPSDVRPPLLALGWPEASLWKGITRASIYTHPPVEGAPPIKEVIRRLVQNAKQLIAIVMDHFTDVDIFLDLVDTSRMRNIPVYILLDHRSLPEFLAMVEASGVNLRQLERMRVRGLVGSAFCSRDGKMVVGSVKERFLLVDGESVVMGSYSFTWTDARLDRSLVALLSGQVVDAFDREFRVLYASSRSLAARTLPDGCPSPPPPFPVSRCHVPRALSEGLGVLRAEGGRPRGCRSLWDLSARSQSSGVGLSGVCGMETEMDGKVRSMKSQDTPAAALMRHRLDKKATETPDVTPRRPKDFYPGRGRSLPLSSRRLGPQHIDAAAAGGRDLPAVQQAQI